jgi:hypothetical protein
MLENVVLRDEAALIHDVVVHKLVPVPAKELPGQTWGSVCCQTASINSKTLSRDRAVDYFCKFRD